MSSSPKIIHITTTVKKKGAITLKNLPLQEGDKVDVVIYETGLDVTTPYPLRGKPVRYEQPFAGVAEKEWEALQ